MQGAIVLRQNPDWCGGACGFKSSILRWPSIADNQSPDAALRLLLAALQRPETKSGANNSDNHNDNLRSEAPLSRPFARFADRYADHSVGEPKQTTEIGVR